MSLIETYQSRKSLLVEKLISKGVQASATDGLTTLINKVDDIHVLQCFASDSVSQSGDTVMLFAVYSPSSGSCSGKTIEFLKVVNDSYTVLGTGVTDDNGVARCEYTCEGVGLLSIVAACDNRMVQSKTYETLDCIKKDMGTSSDHTDIWSTNTTSSTIIVTRTDEYTEFKEAVTDSNIANATNEVTGSCIIEFDYYQVDGELNSFMQLQDSNNNQSYNGGINIGNFGGSPQNWYHLKLQIKDGVLTGTNTTTGTVFTRNLTNTPSKFSFWTSSLITAIRFKNFCIYPI